MHLCLFLFLSFFSSSSLSFHVCLSLFSCLYLSFHVCLSLFSCLSLSLLNELMLCVVCVVCVVCIVCWAVRVVVGLCVLLWWWLWMWLCVCVFFLSGTEKRSRVCVQTLPCVLSKRLRHNGHGRFERTHGRISPSLIVSLYSRVSLSLPFSCLSPLSRSLCSSFSVSCRLSLSLF